MGKDTFRILIVCTGNICRSPLAEQLLKARSQQAQLPLTVTSAGTRAMLGGKIPQEIEHVALNFDLTLSPHAPQLLTDSMIRESHLILVAERAHRAEVVSRIPSAGTKTFTLNQFARIAENYLEDDSFVSGQTLKDFTQEVADFRAIAPPLDNPQDDDITDPYLRDFSIYESAGAHIERCVTSITTSFTTSR